jgi:hypothetical protein
MVTNGWVTAERETEMAIEKGGLGWIMATPSGRISLSFFFLSEK